MDIATRGSLEFVKDVVAEPPHIRVRNRHALLRAVNTQNQTYRQGPAASCDSLKEVHHRILVFSGVLIAPPIHLSATLVIAFSLSGAPCHDVATSETRSPARTYSSLVSSNRTLRRRV